MTTPPTTPWLPPEQYVRTIQQATMYGCLYLTDEADRPLQLHTALPEHPQRWQFPGGNCEFGQTPWQAALRELTEETGLRLEGPPRLLAVCFRLPNEGWPLAKVGFVFDGGVLTAAQLRQVRLDPQEHNAWEVRELEDWQPDMGEYHWRRLLAAHQARTSGVAAYICEDEPAPGADGPTGSGGDGFPGARP
ncbi:NUDIX domain-containing protein [Streptacidiphilus sp. P02-A3a]|uniref:NUDIX domain-containing protein n=1 Tax=Streptacidiphilus sp. P02-A3a TaxID=2704468 RepID=UPI0015FBC537|nr:NUDIX hydrolase [Streptacidiphilus sp. P02-A3a]QMU69737.1 NUDIX hydrolase [Streptacidiphilus sp. P02-A3a]